MKVYDSDDTELSSRDPDRRKVGIAEYAVTTGSTELRTAGLGSCVGVALSDREAGVTGLVHVMLPETDDFDEGNAAKFADAGVELLIEEMVEAGADPDAIEAKLAGGSDMLDFSESGAGIGKRNVERVRSTLAAQDIPVIAEDTGGERGRSLQLDPDTWELVVKSGNEYEKHL